MMTGSFYQEEKDKQQALKDQFRPDKRGIQSKSTNPRRIVLFDILIIVILLGVISPFIMSRFGPVRWIGDYHYSYKVIEADQELIHLLEVEGSEALGSRQPLMEVQFYHDSEPAGSKQLDLAPGAGETRIFSVRVSAEDPVGSVRCRILFDDEEIELNRSL